MPRLSDSDRPGIGMVTAPSTPARTSAGRPWASLPNTSATGRHRSTRSGRSPPWATAAMRIRPRSPSTPSTSCGSQPSTTGTWKSAPADARTVFGLVTSTEPWQKTTPWAPAASALRISVPPLPGSRTSIPTTSRAGSPAPPTTSPSTGGRRRATASTGWGVTVPATRSSTPGARRWTRIPRRAARSSRSGQPASASGATNSASMSAPPSRAASRTLTPSTTNAPSDRRAERWARRRRIRRTRASRAPSPAAPPAAVLGSGERLPGGGHQGAEGARIGHGQVGEDLAVDVDLGRLQPGHEAGVGHVVLPAGGVDAHDPQPAELALADPAVAVGVDAGVHDLLVGRLEAAAAVAAVPLGRLEDGAAVLLAVDGALDPGHDNNLSLAAAEEPLDVLTVTAQYLGAAGETAGALGRLLLQDVGAERLPAADLAGPGDFEALGRAPVGLHLRHRCSSPAGDGRRKITRWARLEPTRPGPGPAPEPGRGRTPPLRPAPRGAAAGRTEPSAGAWATRPPWAPAS